jgi:Na+/H+ antiporter NhaD/arsenite permease-like protein
MLLITLFIAGYLFIAVEHKTGLNKAAIALITGVLCWTVVMFTTCSDPANALMEHLAETASILFFLLGAMTIVELIDVHDGFNIVSLAIRTTSKKILLILVTLISFFLSAVLDNLTTSILMCSLLRTLLTEKNDRWLFAGMIVIAANAGGAWSPIGDVTTTMLWIGGQITAKNTVLKLFIPSLIATAVPLLACCFLVKGPLNRPEPAVSDETQIKPFHRNLMFFAGLSVLLLIPVFKTVAHLPPFMGMLLGLGILWVISEIIHKDRDSEDRKHLSVSYALQKIDTPSILFFLGILLAVAALDVAGVLHEVALSLQNNIGSEDLTVALIGLISAVVDNVPLVAAAMGMYDLQSFPTDSSFWQFLAYCTGTGGSVLIIGSAAGVAAMGIEKITFSWYLRKISWLALLGYFAGIAVYQLMN